MIRDAELQDASEILAIYEPYVASTTVSFETVVPSLAEIERRIEQARSRFAWVVAEEGGRIAGYAYGSHHRDRQAYQWCVEVSAYVDRGLMRRGVGSALYRALFERLAARGFCTALAGIVLPNEVSVRFHERLGFEPVGVYRRAGWKLGAWHDVGWWQRHLRDEPALGLAPPARSER